MGKAEARKVMTEMQEKIKKRVLSGQSYFSKWSKGEQTQIIRWEGKFNEIPIWNWGSALVDSEKAILLRRFEGIGRKDWLPWILTIQRSSAYGRPNNEGWEPRTDADVPPMGTFNKDVFVDNSDEANMDHLLY